MFYRLYMMLTNETNTMNTKETPYHGILLPYSPKYFILGFAYERTYFHDSRHVPDPGKFPEFLKH